MNQILIKHRSALLIFNLLLFCVAFSFNSANAQGLTDYTGVWWPADKEAIVPELVIKQASAEDLVVFFFQSCKTETSGKCFWAEAIGTPHSINNPTADPVQNTDEVTGAFAPFPDEVTYTLSMMSKGILRLDMTINTKKGPLRKVYSYNPKPRKTPQISDNVLSEIKIKNDGPTKPEIKPNLEIKIDPEILVADNMTTGGIRGKALGLTQHCTKYAVIVLKDGERRSQFLDPDPNDCSYSLTGLTPGKYLVSVLINYPNEDNWIISPKQIDNVVYVKAGRTAQFDFTIKPRSDANNNQITGSLSNTRSCGFYQVSFYNVATRKSKVGKFDSSNCWFRVEDLDPGTYQVKLGFSGKADGVVNPEPYPSTITIKKGDRKVIHFKLK